MVYIHGKKIFFSAIESDDLFSKVPGLLCNIYEPYKNNVTSSCHNGCKHCVINRPSYAWL